MSELPPLLWGETQDDWRNSRFEAVSHIAEKTTWKAYPHLEENRVVWRVAFDSYEEKTVAVCDRITAFTEGRFATADDAKAACLQEEIELGGAALAPKTPIPDPDDAPQLTVDEHGYCPTREIVPRFSRNDGALYIFRVWAKPENPAQRIEKKLVGEEYNEAVLSVITQHMVQTLVATITQPDGWLVALVWETLALGQVRLECEVHFAQVRGLFQTPHPGGTTIELKAPSHGMICSIVGEHLARQRDRFEETLATTTELELQRQIARNARALGINSPMPAMPQETGYVLPMTLENMQAEGVDLRGDSLR